MGLVGPSGFVKTPSDVIKDTLDLLPGDAWKPLKEVVNAGIGS